MRVRNITDKFIVPRVFPPLHSSLPLRSIFQFNNWITLHDLMVYCRLSYKKLKSIPKYQTDGIKTAKYMSWKLYIQIFHTLYSCISSYTSCLRSVVCSMFMLSFLTQLLAKANMKRLNSIDSIGKKSSCFSIWLSFHFPFKCSCQREVDLVIGSPNKQKNG